MSAWLCVVGAAWERNLLYHELAVALRQRLLLLRGARQATRALWPAYHHLLTALW